MGCKARPGPPRPGHTLGPAAAPSLQWSPLKVLRSQLAHGAAHGRRAGVCAPPWPRQPPDSCTSVQQVHPEGPKPVRRSLPRPHTLQRRTDGGPPPPGTHTGTTPGEGARTTPSCNKSHLLSPPPDAGTRTPAPSTCARSRFPPGGRERRPCLGQAARLLLMWSPWSSSDHAPLPAALPREPRRPVASSPGERPAARAQITDPPGNRAAPLALHPLLEDTGTRHALFPGPESGRRRAPPTWGAGSGSAGELAPAPRPQRSDKDTGAPRTLVPLWRDARVTTALREALQLPTRPPEDVGRRLPKAAPLTGPPPEQARGAPEGWHPMLRAAGSRLDRSAAREGEARQRDLSLNGLAPAARQVLLRLSKGPLPKGPLSAGQSTGGRSRTRAAATTPPGVDEPPSRCRPGSPGDRRCLGQADREGPLLRQPPRSCCAHDNSAHGPPTPRDGAETTCCLSGECRQPDPSQGNGESAPPPSVRGHDNEVLVAGSSRAPPAAQMSDDLSFQDSTLLGLGEGRHAEPGRDGPQSPGLSAASQPARDQQERRPWVLVREAESDGTEGDPGSSGTAGSGDHPATPDEGDAPKRALRRGATARAATGRKVPGRPAPPLAEGPSLRFLTLPAGWPRHRLRPAERSAQDPCLPKPGLQEPSDLAPASRRLSQRSGPGLPPGSTPEAGSWGDKPQEQRRCASRATCLPGLGVPCAGAGCAPPPHWFLMRLTGTRCTALVPKGSEGPGVDSTPPCAQANPPPAGPDRQEEPRARTLPDTGAPRHSDLATEWAPKTPARLNWLKPAKTKTLAVQPGSEQTFMGRTSARDPRGAGSEAQLSAAAAAAEKPRPDFQLPRSRPPVPGPLEPGILLCAGPVLQTRVTSGHAEQLLKEEETSAQPPAAQHPPRTPGCGSGCGSSADDPPGHAQGDFRGSVPGPALSGASRWTGGAFGGPASLRLENQPCPQNRPPRTPGALTSEKGQPSDATEAVALPTPDVDPQPPARGTGFHCKGCSGARAGRRARGDQQDSPRRRNGHHPGAIFSGYPSRPRTFGEPPGPSPRETAGGRGRGAAQHLPPESPRISEVRGQCFEEATGEAGTAPAGAGHRRTSRSHGGTQTHSRPPARRKAEHRSSRADR
ncbi:basic proline-rich protein-like [Phyllostomus discolor]|uniref:Basic proline-rich protein-like n=1 Tax=Phyllostomus discolor TaxID=89673 RepID=A0A7E6DP86_9CHIR|nr:basic proline-rich protein-like [Phyllostomus discolor]